MEKLEAHRLSIPERGRGQVNFAGAAAAKWAHHAVAVIFHGFECHCAFPPFTEVMLVGEKYEKVSRLKSADLSQPEDDIPPLAAFHAGDHKLASEDAVPFISLGGSRLNCCFNVLRYFICACSIAGSLPNWPFSTSSATISVRAAKNALNSLASVSLPNSAPASSIYWCNACKTASLSEEDERWSPGRGFSASCNMPWIKSLPG